MIVRYQKTIDYLLSSISKPLSVLQCTNHLCNEQNSLIETLCHDMMH